MKPLDRKKQQDNFTAFLEPESIRNITCKKIDLSGIKTILPNRPPNLLIESAIIMQCGNGDHYCKGKMTVTEKHCAGHYPNVPILPFAQIGELIAQTGAVLLRQVSEQFASSLPLVVEANGLRGGNAGRIYPTDKLIVIVRLIRCRGPAATVTAVVYQEDDEVVATMEELKYLAVVPEVSKSKTVQEQVQEQ